MKPTATSRSAFTDSLSRHLNQRINVRAATAAKPNVSACICKQASKCLAAMETQRCSRTTMRACLRTTDDPQTNRHSATHHGKFSQCSQTPTDKAQDAWTISPATKQGRQRRALGQNRAAAPQRRPRAREPFSAAVECDGTQAPGSPVESCVKCPE
jgi:hypothetical protein